MQSPHPCGRSIDRPLATTGSQRRPPAAAAVHRGTSPIESGSAFWNSAARTLLASPASRAGRKISPGSAKPPSRSMPQRPARNGIENPRSDSTAWHGLGGKPRRSRNFCCPLRRRGGHPSHDDCRRLSIPHVAAPLGLEACCECQTLVSRGAIGGSEPKLSGCSSRQTPIGRPPDPANVPAPNVSAETITSKGPDPPELLRGHSEKRLDPVKLWQNRPRLTHEGSGCHSLEFPLDDGELLAASIKKHFAGELRLPLTAVSLPAWVVQALSVKLCVCSSAMRIVDTAGLPR